LPRKLLVKRGKGEKPPRREKNEWTEVPLSLPVERGGQKDQLAGGKKADFFREEKRVHLSEKIRTECSATRKEGEGELRKRKRFAQAELPLQPKQHRISRRTLTSRGDRGGDFGKKREERKKERGGHFWQGGENAFIRERRREKRKTILKEPRRKGNHLWNMTWGR